jgi:pyruvate/2-oxoglutarate dehydrogenase complex dihydrolipoamide acyltransferase (E2) component
MNNNQAAFRFVPISPNRLAIIDSLHEAKRKPAIHLATSFDVTSARRALRDYETRTGNRLSFTAFLVYCLGRAIDEDKTMQAYRRGNRIVIFDEVDTCVLVEHEVGDERVAAPHVIRATNKKSLPQIHNEIRAAQSGGAQAEESWRYISYYPLIPRFVRRVFWRMLYTHPEMMKRTAGTVCVTSLGMFTPGQTWGIPVSGYTLTLTVGAVTSRSEIIEGQNVQRDYLSFSISVDHEIIDGGQLARFADRFRRAIEKLQDNFDNS